MINNKIQTIQIEKILYGGDGLGRNSEGLAVFVPGTAVGEIVEVEIIETRSQFLRGRILKVLEPSSERRDPPCLHYNSCGGCQLQHLSYAAQLIAKVEILKEALTRIGKFNWIKPIEIISGPEWNYRGRTQFKLEKSLTNDSLRVGFFSAGSQNLCEIEKCLVLDDSLNLALPSLKRTAPYSMQRSVGDINLATNADSTHKNLSILSASSPKFGLSTDPITRQVGKFNYTYDAKCFFQVNIFLLETLVTEVLKLQSKGEIAVDLYAGVGLFSLALSEYFEFVYAAEESILAGQYAEQNIKQNNISNVSFSHQSVERWIKENNSLRGQISTVVVDPPRIGIGPKTLERLINLEPQQITYVSCNPTTLARDLKILCTEKYELSSVIALDLFPQTYHVETIANLTLSN